MRANLKRHIRVYTHSSKRIYLPMRARVVSQLFYDWSPYGNYKTKESQKTYNFRQN